MPFTVRRRVKSLTPGSPPGRSFLDRRPPAALAPFTPTPFAATRPTRLTARAATPSQELRRHRLKLVAGELAILVGSEFEHPLDEATGASRATGPTPSGAAASFTASPSFAATATPGATSSFGRGHGEDLLTRELAILVGIATGEHPLHPGRQLVGG
jgi:hypothetical protein